jgi:hypothetical protein
VCAAQQGAAADAPPPRGLRGPRAGGRPGRWQRRRPPAGVSSGYTGGAQLSAGPLGGAKTNCRTAGSSFSPSLSLRCSRSSALVTRSGSSKFRVQPLTRPTSRARSESSEPRPTFRKPTSPTTELFGRFFSFPATLSHRRRDPRPGSSSSPPKHGAETSDSNLRGLVARGAQIIVGMPKAPSVAYSSRFHLHAFRSAPRRLTRRCS